MERVFRKQKAAIRILANIGSMDSCKPHFVSLNILTLYGQIILDNIVNTKLHINSQQTHSDIHDYNTRNRDNLLTPRHRLSKHNYLGIQLYNKLPMSIKSLNNRIFKKRLKNYLIRVNPYSVEDFAVALRLTPIEVGT